jgi:hypothetical protein
MAKHRETKKKSAGQTTKGVSRRHFVTSGAAAGFGAAALLGTDDAGAQRRGGTEIEWHYEVDVVVCGGGCAGLTAAIRARDLGAEVLVVDQNFDLGGRMLHSGSFVSLGGGDPLQLRDMRGESDKEGFVTAAPVQEPAELDDNVELLFRDITDWSVVDSGGGAPYRYNEREMVRAWAENCGATRQFLIDNYVRFGRVNGTHVGGGISRARGASCFLMLGDRTDIKAGTVTAEDAGVADRERSSAFAPVQMTNSERTVSPGAVANGAALARSLEFSAREKGVQIMLFRHFDELVREEPFAGRILGIKAHYSPRLHPDTGERMVSYWQNGNIDERREVINIRARKAVVLASGGHAGNPTVRSMFYPAMREPAFPTSGHSLQGDSGQDGSAMIASLRVGAALAGMQQNPTGLTYHISTRLGTRDAYTTMMPGHPTFGLRGSAGVNVGTAGFEEFIAVNQVGKRFFNEVRLSGRPGGSQYPGRGIVPNPGIEHKQYDWHNCAEEWLRTTYSYNHGLDAALAINEGSEPPHYYSGPLWAIFDQDTVERNPNWELRFPYVADNGYYFSAGTIEELAAKIEAGHEYQRVPLRYLAETVRTWNGYVDAGKDPDFERETDGDMHRIARAPFHALAIMVIWHDSFGGLRCNGKQQVVDMQGQVIPGLYAGGEAVGGFSKHGLGKGHVQGFIAGTNAAAEPDA